MTVFLLLYICTDASRTDCMVLPAQLWNGPDAYEQCLGEVSDLTKALSAHNRELHRFVCEFQSDGAQPAEIRARPVFTHESFRM